MERQLAGTDGLHFYYSTLYLGDKDKVCTQKPRRMDLHMLPSFQQNTKLLGWSLTPRTQNYGADIGGMWDHVENLLGNACGLASLTWSPKSGRVALKLQCCGPHNRSGNDKNQWADHWRHKSVKKKDGDAWHGSQVRSSGDSALCYTGWSMFLYVLYFDVLCSLMRAGICQDTSTCWRTQEGPDASQRWPWVICFLIYKIHLAFFTLNPWHGLIMGGFRITYVHISLWGTTLFS